MGENNQAFVDLSYQGRLRKSSELVQVEIHLFIEFLEEHGMAMIDVPGYSVPQLGAPRDPHDRTPFWLKVRGLWTRLLLEERLPGVFVLYDR
jgi:hypothetical protein